MWNAFRNMVPFILYHFNDIGGGVLFFSGFSLLYLYVTETLAL